VRRSGLHSRRDLDRRCGGRCRECGFLSAEADAAKPMWTAALEQLISG